MVVIVLSVSFHGKVFVGGYAVGVVGGCVCGGAVFCCCGCFYGYVVVVIDVVCGGGFGIAAPYRDWETDRKSVV